MDTDTPVAPPVTPLREGDIVSKAEERRVIFASSLGTVFEWYDFYLYAVLAPFFAGLFFPKGNETAQVLQAFATYAAGFLVRPFGAIVFGRIGDLVGRKYTFLVTITVMGASTFLVGLLPTFASVGYLAPALLLALRLLQGLALGGEYGGAATYVAEHTPNSRRGYATSWIQTTATLGLLLALIVIGLCRGFIDKAVFESWAWRIPFLLSLVLLMFSIYIRLRLNESPVFKRMKAENRGSKSPLIESFFHYPNNKYVLLALLGATAGQGVVWYTGQFYALFFIGSTLHLDYVTTYMLIGASLVIGTPFFIFFGRLSDKIGRLKIILAGCLIAAVTYIPIFHGLTHYVNPALEAFAARTPITVAATDCEFHIFVMPWTKFTACDNAKDYLTKAGLRAGGGDEDRRRRAQGLSEGPENRGRSSLRRHVETARVHPDRGQERGQLSDDVAVAGHHGHLRHHGVRAHCRVPGRALPDQDPLHLHVPPLSHRQRLVRRHAAAPGHGDGGCIGEHLSRAVVPHRGSGDDVRHRGALPARHQELRHPDLTAPPVRESQIPARPGSMRV
jgi:MFS family permease